MAFEFDEGPRAGEKFRFFRGSSQVRRATAIVDGQEIKVDSEDCPDPPCHEYVRIPAGTEGKRLRLQEIASNAQIVTNVELLISGSEGAEMTASAHS